MGRPGRPPTLSPHRHHCATVFFHSFHPRAAVQHLRPAAAYRHSQCPSCCRHGWAPRGRLAHQHHRRRRQHRQQQEQFQMPKHLQVSHRQKLLHHPHCGEARDVPGQRVLQRRRHPRSAHQGHHRCHRQWPLRPSVSTASPSPASSWRAAPPPAHRPASCTLASLSGSQAPAAPPALVE